MANYSSVVLDSLLRMDELAQSVRRGEYAISENQNEWRGLGFMLNGQQVVAATGEVTEIVEFPESVTIVPGTPEWMIGLANFHGEVLSISDLQCFVGGSPVKRGDEQSKVLVVKNRGKYTGLLVSSVLGIKYLPADRKQEYVPLDNLFDVFICEMFDLEDEVWPIISMAALLSDKRFLMS